MSDLPITEDMPSRFGGLVTRISLIVVVLVLATATLTFAARRQATQAAPVTAPAPRHVVLTVPNVEHQVYVFAKGVLEDAGFAWRVGPGAPGYAGYRVVSQSPAPGTRVLDTGEPTLVLTLERDPHYSTAGHSPDSGSPYAGSRIRLADAVSNEVAPAPKRSQRAVVKPIVKVAPKAKPVAKKPVVKKPVVKAAPKAKPVAKKPVATKPVATKPVASKPVVKKAAAPARRTPDFVVAGAPKEPLDEMTLPARAALLRTWVGTHTTPSSANVQHWLYQHSWIVAGAKFGWWHGAEALKTLIEVDRTVERDWSMGSKSEADAQTALDFVNSR